MRGTQRSQLRIYVHRHVVNILDSPTAPRAGRDERCGNDGPAPALGLGQGPADHRNQPIQQLHSSLGHKPEFKFSKCDARVRDGFFEAVASCPFTVRALVVEKKVIYSEELRRNNDCFYNYFVKQLMNFDSGVLRSARVRIDGSGGRDFQRALGSYLRRELRGKIRDVKMVDSSRDAVMQLADMSIGAIARSYRERPDAARWRNMLRSRIENVWMFR